MCHTADMTSQWEQIDEAAYCVVSVLPETWQHDIRSRVGVNAVGAIASRLRLGDEAAYAPFSQEGAVNITAHLTEDRGVELRLAELVVAAAWWALHLAGRDTMGYAVLDLAKQAVAWRSGYMLGTLNPALPCRDGLPVA